MIWYDIRDACMLWCTLHVYVRSRSKKSATSRSQNSCRSRNFNNGHWREKDFHILYWKPVFPPRKGMIVLYPLYWRLPRFSVAVRNYFIISAVACISVCGMYVRSVWSRGYSDWQMCMLQLVKLSINYCIIIVVFFHPTVLRHESFNVDHSQTWAFPKKEIHKGNRHKKEIHAQSKASRRSNSRVPGRGGVNGIICNIKTRMPGVSRSFGSWASTTQLTAAWRIL